MAPSRASPPLRAEGFNVFFDYKIISVKNLDKIVAKLMYTVLMPLMIIVIVFGHGGLNNASVLQVVLVFLMFLAPGYLIWIRAHTSNYLDTEAVKRQLNRVLLVSYSIVSILALIALVNSYRVVPVLNPFRILCQLLHGSHA